MKLTEIHDPRGYRARSDAERIFDVWHDYNPWGLDETRDKFPDYQDREHTQAVDHIMAQMDDFINNKTVFGVEGDAELRKEIVRQLRKHVEAALGN